MLDQSFSTSEFVEIFDRENRKGRNVESMFPQDFHKSLEHLREIQELTNQIKSETDPERKMALYERREGLKSERISEIKRVLEVTAEGLNTRVSDISLEDIGLVNKKRTYRLESKIENFFLSKKVQLNIKRTYKVKPASRYTILSQLTNLLTDGSPKYIIRTDVSAFFESIPQQVVRNKLNKDHLLSTMSKRVINKVLDEYNRLQPHFDSSAPKGIPRGVGFSPYLAEIFMRGIDNQIRLMADLVYYARYVDDMILIFIPKSIEASNSHTIRYSQNLEKVFNENGLVLSNKKTGYFNILKTYDQIVRKEALDDNGVKSTSERKPANAINFLGYTISANKYTVISGQKRKLAYEIAIDLSTRKIENYKKKLKVCFKTFESKRKANEKKAFELLLTRVMFLTGNTRLRSNKSKILIGVYYSNPFLLNDSSLIQLDRSLKYWIYQSKLTNEQQSRLLYFSFTLGYQEKRFNSFPIRKRVYKNHNAINRDLQNANNKGVVQYGLTEIGSIWRDY